MKVSDSQSPSGNIDASASAISCIAASEEESKVADELNSENKEVIHLENQEEKDIREKIIVVDDIPEASEYRDSRAILKEIKKVSEVDIEFAYQLAKGGIAIHTGTAEERNQLHSKLIEHKAFKGGKVSKLGQEKSKKLFIKNVNTKVSTAEIAEKLTQKNIRVGDCKRVVNSFTKRPTRTIRVLVASEDIDKALNVEIRVGQVTCAIEKQRITSVVRCYECQQFGHISKNCIAGKCCVVCAGEHTSDYNCKVTSQM